MNQIQLQYNQPHLSAVGKFRQLFLREFVGMYLIGFLTLGLSFFVSIVMIVRRPDNKGLHDLIGGTQVVEHEQEQETPTYAPKQHASS